ncbi:MAG: alpha/beta fold hydrolase [Microbacteriaceae bacterium]|nr:alpha/beta fold hydrolase [Microbacteriaceae bacterium]
MPELLFLPALTQDDHAYDLLGLPGRTALYPSTGDRPPEPVTLEGIADEIAATITEPVDLVGVALGRIIGQYLLIRHPGLVRSAVLANTPSGVGDPATLHERADAALETGLASTSEALVTRWFRPSTIAADAAGVEYIRRMIATLPTESFAFMQRAMAATDTAAGLPGVRVPVTLVQATDDPVGPDAIGVIHGLIPDSRLVRIPGAHMVHLDNPEGLRDVVLEHLAWIRSWTPAVRQRTGERETDE